MVCTDRKAAFVTSVVVEVLRPSQSLLNQTSVVCNCDIEGISKRREVKLGNIKCEKPSSVHRDLQKQPMTVWLRLQLSQSSNRIADHGAIESDATQIRSESSSDNNYQESVTKHGLNWSPRDIFTLLNGPARCPFWSVSSISGYRISEGQGYVDMQHLDY